MNDMDSDIQDRIEALTSFFSAFRTDSGLVDEPQGYIGSRVEAETLATAIEEDAVETAVSSGAI